MSKFLKMLACIKMASVPKTVCRFTRFHLVQTEEEPIYKVSTGPQAPLSSCLVNNSMLLSPTAS